MHFTHEYPPVHPWPAQEVAWHDNNPNVRKASYDRQVAAGYSHLIREVRFTPVNRAEPNDLGSVLDHVEQEFGLLRRFEVEVADHDWHITRGLDNRARLLARVAIIEGQPADLTARKDSNRIYWEDFRNRLWGYLNCAASGPRLSDVLFLTQYVFGCVRGEGTLSPRPVLVDIEPLFESRFAY